MNSHLYYFIKFINYAISLYKVERNYKNIKGSTKMTPSLIRYQPLAELSREVDRLFDGRFFAPYRMLALKPGIDMYQTEFTSGYIRPDIQELV